jgi:DNA repair exonuclease SbcCD nuclease subunit
MTLTIQYCSDLHLEFYNIVPEIEPCAPILCLVGDIGYPSSKIYEQFLISVNSKFQKVFIIAGNHEYYNDDTIEDTNEIIKNIIQKNNLSSITFLNNTCEYYMDYLFVGSTLWSHIYNPTYTTNDINCIQNMTVDTYNDMHEISKKYLEEIILAHTNDNIIMLTHFLPSFSLIDEKYEQYSKYNQCFASHLTHLIKSPIKLWIYGHTHTKGDTIINNVRLVCNPIGYPDENKNTSYCTLVKI